ncbi:MAG: D-alanyl-D-alanine carboxypeptidase, partial [Alphaproteobacteria bacterium]|nr:D-alanyl-D-alanine carboxypeptidase [Alphaproteobacteria bacterium]
VRAGSTITVKDAVMAVIVKSANDCATVLAEHFAKSEREFAVMMTQTAHKLGMKHTTFKNASGLPNSAQKSTARDMATLAMAVYHHFPQYYKWFSAQSFRYQGRTITGHNHLLSTFTGADGMKTGYTAASGYNIVTSAHRNNKRVIAVTMGHRYWGERDKKAALMMDKGLQHLKKSDNIDVAVLSREINGGKTASAPTKLASVQTKHAPVAAPKAPAQKSATVAQVVQNGKYAVQVGSFSNYKRAKNYALSVKNNLAKKFAVHHIAVEKVNSTNGTMYRSKVVGLAKRDAAKICANMKRQKKSCFVTADNNSMKLAQK